MRARARARIPQRSSRGGMKGATKPLDGATSKQDSQRHSDPGQYESKAEIYPSFGLSALRAVAERNKECTPRLLPPNPEPEAISPCRRIKPESYFLCFPAR